MKFLIILFLQLSCILNAEDSYFFLIEESESPEFKIQDDRLLMSMRLKKIKPPKASSMSIFPQGGDEALYKIQINLIDRPVKGWFPKLKLGESLIIEGLSVGRPNDKKFASDFSITHTDLEIIKKWVSILASLLNLPEEKIFFDVDKASNHKKKQ